MVGIYCNKNRYLQLILSNQIQYFGGDVSVLVFYLIVKWIFRLLKNLTCVNIKLSVKFFYLILF